MHTTDWIVLLFICAVVAASIVFRKLTVTGALTGGCLAALLYKGAGITGIIMLGAFFVAGTAATAFGRRRKEQLGIAEKNKGQRNAWQVLANGGVAALAGLLAWLYPQQAELWRLAAAASLASASADTLSSEMGSVYGKSFYNILSFKKDQCGLDGVISLEGTLWGIAGSVLIALAFVIAYGYSALVIWIVLAGFTKRLVKKRPGEFFEYADCCVGGHSRLLDLISGAISSTEYFFNSLGVLGPK
jgi:uncharacterized protein (TIGR00297 family)